MKVKLSVFSLLVMLFSESAFAGWQNDGYYIRDGYYVDNGSRFVMGLRGGLSLAKAKMQNDIGTLQTNYMADQYGYVVTKFAWEHDDSPSGFYPIGIGDVATLPVRKDFSKMAFTAGVSLGFTLPYHPNWRLEAGLDHISETDYNETPFLEGEMFFSGGSTGVVQSSGVNSTVTTDIISVMAFYDFFDGNKKQPDVLIPYIGFGVGYASSKTTLRLADIYGDLSEDSDLQKYGTIDDNDVLQFTDPSLSTAPTSSNVAFIGSLGASYGISEYTFLDFNFRMMYVPKITWQLVSGSANRDWFSAKDMIYTNFMVGIRFEF